MPDSSQVKHPRQGEFWGDPRPREWVRLSKSCSCSVAEPGWGPGPANDVLALCTGAVTRKGTCGTLTLNGFGVWVWQLLCLLQNKHRNYHMLAFHLRERRKQRPEVTCKGSYTAPRFAFCALDRSWHWGQALAPSSYLSCPAGTLSKWCWACSLACSLF